MLDVWVHVQKQAQKAPGRQLCGAVAWSALQCGSAEAWGAPLGPRCLCQHTYLPTEHSLEDISLALELIPHQVIDILEKATLC